MARLAEEFKNNIKLKLIDKFKYMSTIAYEAQRLKERMVYLIDEDTNSFEKVEMINDSIRIFGAKISDLHAGNINLMIGAVIKWHFLKMPFYNHNVFDFLNLFTCMLLSLFLFYLIFHYFIKQNIYEMHEFIKKYYLLFFLPCFGLFITALDHGRTINIFLTHLISFYLALRLIITNLK